MTEQNTDLKSALEEKLSALWAQRDAMEDEAPDERDTEAFEDWLFECDALEDEIDELREQLDRMT